MLFSGKELKRKRRRKLQSGKAYQLVQNIPILDWVRPSACRYSSDELWHFHWLFKSCSKNQAAKLQVQPNLMHAAQHANAKAFAKLIEELKPSKD